MAESPAFRADLNKAIKVLCREVRDGCIFMMAYRTLCTACKKYINAACNHPATYIEMPGGRVRIPIPQCSRGYHE